MQRCLDLVIESIISNDKFPHLKLRINYKVYIIIMFCVVKKMFAPPTHIFPPEQFPITPISVNLFYNYNKTINLS